jgi:hypothetical protein
VDKILRDYSLRQEKLILRETQLQLKRPQPQVPSKTQTNIVNNSQKTDPDISTFKLSSAMYGTLIGTAAMRNLIDQNWKNEATPISQYGCIVHQRFDTPLQSSSLTIDTKKRTFSINLELKRHFRFVWNFRE